MKNIKGQLHLFTYLMNNGQNKIQIEEIEQISPWLVQAEFVGLITM